MPTPTRREGVVLQNVAGKGIFAQNDEEHATPLGVVVRSLIEDDRDEGLNVDDGGGLCPDGLMCVLVVVQGSSTKASFFSAAHVLCSLGGSSSVNLHREETARRSDQGC